MKIKVRLYGMLADSAGIAELEIEEENSVSGLRSRLSSVHPVFARSSYLVAVNRKIVKDDVTLNETDEIALMPPFSGG